MNTTTRLRSTFKALSPSQRFGVALLLLGFGYLLLSYTLLPWLVSLALQDKLQWGFLQNWVAPFRAASDPYDAAYGMLMHHALSAVAWLVVPGTVLLLSSSQFFHTNVLGGATALSLAYIRILVSAVLFLAYTFEPFSQMAIYPAAHTADMGLGVLVNWLPQSLPGLFDSPGFWQVWRALLLLVLLCYLVGWRTRVVGPLVAVMVFATECWLRGYTAYYNHQHLVSWYVVAALAFFPSGDTWSVDNLRRKRLGRAIAPLTPGAAYAWGRFFVFLIIGLAYLEAGLSKLMHAGWEWPLGEGVYGLSLNSSVSHTNFDFWFISWDLPMWWYTLLGIGTLVFELLAPVVLFWQASRWVLPFAISAMHLGILFFMHILFNDLILLPFALLPIEAIYTRFTRGSHTPTAAITPAMGWPYRLKLGMAALLTMLALLLVRYQTEWFPFTAFQMFSYHLPPDFTIEETTLGVTDAQGKLHLVPGPEVPPILRINQRLAYVPGYGPEKQTELLRRFKARFYPEAHSIAILRRTCQLQDCPQMSAYQPLVTYPAKP